MRKLTAELDKLCVLLDQDIDTFYIRIRAIQKGEMGKVKFIDERILPQIRKRALQQTEYIIKYWDDNYGK